MKLQAKIAKAVAKISMDTAKRACGAASCYCLYQTKEPKAVQKIAK